MDGFALLDALTSGALLVDETGKIRYANPAFCSVSGFTANDLRGRALKDLIYLPSKADCALCLGVSGHQAQWATLHGGVLTLAPKNGQDVPEELRIKIKHSGLPDAQVLCLVDPFSEDTTLTQAHSDFVSTVSHEFRTPLTSIKGFADTLLKYGTQLPEEEKRRFLNIIKEQSDRLIRLVENLLTVSKLGASRVEMSYRPVALHRLLDKVIHSVRAKAQAKAANSEHLFDVQVKPSDLEVWADPDRMEQVLINLIDNAVKYSPAGSMVRIRAELLSGDDTQVCIIVQDEGAGIPEELLPKLFTKFYRVESPLKQEVEGTGLGLYITKSLTNAMGGKITVDSAAGQGSTFTVILPAATLERQAAHRRRLYAEDLRL
jgi:two-component system phosphate regulon sensor histidine kinase PhoR